MLLCTLRTELLGSREVIKVEEIFDFISGEALIFLTTLSFDELSPFLLGPGDSLQVILSLK